jgi:small-conductance mechanosensitive channel
MEVLRNHRAVLPQPEPLVLVDELGPAAVNLKVSYWFDSSTYAPNKINSALLRISKNVLLQAGIELPDPAREIVFPKGVPLTRVAQRDQPKERDQRKKPFKPRLLEKGEAQEMTVSEGNLVNECPELDEVDEIPEATENLLTR